MLPRLSLFLLTTAVILAITVLGGTLLFRELLHSAFLYNEADYAYAASQGIKANYLDVPTTSLTDFLSLGLADRSASMNTETQGKTGQSLSETIRASDDITFYRHLHSPLYFYGLNIVRSLFGSDERRLRCVSVLAIVAATALTACFAFLLLLQVGAGISPAVAAGATALSFSAGSSILIETGMTVTPHSLFTVVVAVTLGCSGMFLASRRQAWWYATAVTLGLAFLTVEYAPILLVSVVLAVMLVQPGWRKEVRKQSVRLILEMGLIITGVMFLLWPGGFVKLTIIKNYLFFAYYLGSPGERLQSAAAHGNLGTTDCRLTAVATRTCGLMLLGVAEAQKTNGGLYPALCLLRTAVPARQLA